MNMVPYRSFLLLVDKFLATTKKYCFTRGGGFTNPYTFPTPLLIPLLGSRLIFHHFVFYDFGGFSAAPPFCLLGLRVIFRDSMFLVFGGIFRCFDVPRFHVLGFEGIFRHSAVPRFHLLRSGVIFHGSVIPPFRRSTVLLFRLLGSSRIGDIFAVPRFHLLGFRLILRHFIF